MVLAFSPLRVEEKETAAEDAVRLPLAVLEPSDVALEPHRNQACAETPPLLTILDAPRSRGK